MADVIVEITQGKLRGRIAKDANGNYYKSFQGIPYAKPPIGKLRFKAPKPAEPWKEDILDATKERSVCPVTFALPGTDSGSEDCLFLNVYTPQLPKESQTKLPVMVWIHGGAFNMGSGNSETFGPEFLVAKNVILVTLNYRLGYLGFLRLNDPKCEVTGNAGLKDQTEALHWVQKNISAFGGDPNNVTLFGESAGSASVSFHLLSPLSKGLFHKAILQSGVALNPWAIQIRRDYDFVRLLGCTSTNDIEILDFLQNQKIEDILKAQTLSTSPETQPCGEICEVTPDIELNNPSAFLTDSPENLLKKGLINAVPIMIGTNDAEGLITILPLYKKFTLYSFEKDLLIPRDLLEKLKSKDEIEKTTKKIKEFYKFNDYESMKDYWSDVLFTYKTQVFAREIARKSNHPVYNYLFQISIDEMKRACAIFNLDLYEGAAHAEELGYLFKSVFGSLPSSNTPLGIAVHIMSTLWTNFAKTSNPNPEIPDPHINVEWKPFTINDENYLEIGSKLQLKKNLLHERIQFWDNLYFEKMDNVVVEIEQGKLCGRIAEDLNGNDYKSFQGIPYAKPPVGNLRFKAPELPDPWEDEILDVKTERSICYQRNYKPWEKNYEGSEDCLFLNVFTPKLPKESSAKLPVMVWIHGGAFTSGSSTIESFGPEFLVAKLIVLVTINYRLGFLGFLSLKDPTCEVTGNAGLKDQIQALRWVNKNIAAFGGDPNNVTVFGESSGSVSISFLLLSPLSKGLFHKAILQSGTALVPWALQVRHDYEFIHLLGCKSTDDREILEFLQNQNLEDILNAQNTVASPEAHPFGELCDISPNIEPNIPSALITDTPENILREGRFHQIPIIIGVNDKEGIMMDLPLYKPLKEYWFNNDVLVTQDLQEQLKSKDEIEKTNKKIMEFYKITEIDNITDCLTDTLFAYKIGTFIKKYARYTSQPIYNYLFRISIESMKMQSKMYNLKPYEGASHSEEVPYLFYQKLTPEILPNSSEALGIHIMTTLWTNFAKNTNPNPVIVLPYFNVEWKPFTLNEENYLDIDLKPQLKKDLLKERMQFWDNLYRQ
ncbi:uncharacterized protein LOC123294263 [Chrysoperla carnea]|uniref:uncharacterized protein LOC123294263 n=1 Tax=Chrysoperla carnea TaxID=189513 RepID=UPI001D076DF5|nr:uncharacterized protein LOC123294263 [Chrysoperla carnea]